MLNIKVQCCGMVLLWLVTFFYSRFPKIEVRTKKIFGLLLALSVLGDTADIASVAAIYYADTVPEFWVKLSCKVYLAFLIAVIFAGFLYLCADVCFDKKKFRRIEIACGAGLAVSLTAMALAPIGYFCAEDGNIVYSYGPSTLVTYITFGILFTMAQLLMHFGKKTMQPRRKLAVRIWLAIWLLSALLQLIFSSLLVVSFGGCLGVLIVFLMIENPELCLDSGSGFFRTESMPRYITEFFGEGKRFYLINTRFLAEQKDFYEKIVNCVIFVGSGEICLIFEEKESFDAALWLIADEFDKQPIYICEDSSIAETSVELFHILKEAQQFIKKDRAANIYEVSAEVKAQLEERKNTKILIAEAIAENRIEAFYQPICSVDTGEFSSAEALARIRGKNGEIIPPWKFIPIAEEDGSIIEIGKIMFENVCRFLKEESPDKLGLKYFEINISVIQGEDKRLAPDILSIMDSHGISTDRINLEITESASISGREQLLENMTDLIREGVHFSLDDFGTGQSNLDYMSSMPVKLVKFDRAMTQSYFTSEKTRCIMDAAVNMIHEMGMKIVVEGIETKEQAEYMKDIGADHIQGYYYSKPLPEKEFIEFLKNNNRRKNK